MVEGSSRVWVWAGSVLTCMLYSLCSKEDTIPSARRGRRRNIFSHFQLQSDLYTCCSDPLVSRLLCCYQSQWNLRHSTPFCSLILYSAMSMALQFDESSTSVRRVKHIPIQPSQSVNNAIVLTRVKKSVNRRNAGIRSSVGREPSKENSWVRCEVRPAESWAIKDKQKK